VGGKKPDICRIFQPPPIPIGGLETGKMSWLGKFSTLRQPGIELGFLVIIEVLSEAAVEI